MCVHEHWARCPVHSCRRRSGRYWGNDRDSYDSGCNGNDDFNAGRRGDCVHRRSWPRNSRGCLGHRAWCHGFGSRRTARRRKCRCKASGPKTIRRTRIPQCGQSRSQASRSHSFICEIRIWPEKTITTSSVHSNFRPVGNQPRRRVTHRLSRQPRRLPSGSMHGGRNRRWLRQGTDVAASGLRRYVLRAANVTSPQLLKGEDSDPSLRDLPHAHRRRM